MNKTTQQEALCSSGFEISFGKTTYSRAQMKTESELVAAYLSEKGIEPGKRVAVMMTRSFELIAAITGVIMTGGAVIMLSKDTPGSRYDFIVGDANPDMVITDEKYKEIISSKAVFDSLKLKTARVEDDALILYTSGSTGLPKGVIHTQESFAKIINEINKSFEKEAHDITRSIALTDATFISFFIFEYGFCLTGNRNMSLLGEDEVNSPAKFIKALDTDEKFLIFMTPSRYNAMAESDKVKQALNKDGVLILAGEKFPGELEERVKNYYSERLVIMDIYGSTECGLIYGRNIRNGSSTCFTPYKLLGSGQEAVDNGEICVDNECIFRDYSVQGLKKTVSADGKEYFPTGDLARLSEDGSLVILGRNDRMIKYNGLRIELDEITQVLKKCKGVTDAVVVYSKKNNRIAAFYVAEEELKLKELRDEMSHTIPFFMLPHAFTHISSIPMSSHGKADYQKLVGSFDESYTLFADSGNEEDKPSTEKEKILSKILKDITGIDAPMSLSCMELGVDSLRGLSLISELGERGLMVSLKDIILSSNLHELALRIKEKVSTGKKDRGTVSDFLPVTNEYHKFLINAERAGNDMLAMWISDSFIGRASYDSKSFKDRIELLVKRHPALSSRFSPSEEDGFIQEFGKEFPHVSFFDVSGTKDEEIEGKLREYEMTFLKQLEEKEGNRECAFACFKLDENRCAFHIKISHVISDGMSQQILISELLADSLTDESDSYFEYRSWMRDEENKKKAMEFFKGYVEGADFAYVKELVEGPPGMPPVPPMPAMPDMDGVPLMSFDNNIVKKVPMGKTKDLTGVTPFVFILYRYANAVIKTFEKNRMLFYITSSGRNIPVDGMDKVVGDLSYRMSVVIEKGQSIDKFMEGVYEAENHLCITPEELWSQIIDDGREPVNFPILVSEVFPDYTGGKLLKSLGGRQLDPLGINAYFLEEDGEMFIRVSYNPLLKDEAIYKKFINMLESEV